MSVCVVHLGASSTFLAIADDDCRIVSQTLRYVPLYERARQTYVELIDEVLSVFLLPGAASVVDQLTALVVTAPTPVAWPSGHVGLCPGMPALQDRHLRRDICERLSQLHKISPDVLIENDANAAAILWASRNPEQGSDPHLHCRLSTGVGGCIMVEGRPWRGHRSLAGEIGHMTVQPFGTLCGCGNRGCLETVAGGKALQGLYAELLGKTQAPHFMTLLNDWHEYRIDLSRHLQAMGTYLGIGLASAVNLMNPAFVVVSGPLLDQRSMLRDAMHTEFLQRVCASLECSLIFDETSADDPFDAGIEVLKHWRRESMQRTVA